MFRADNEQKCPNCAEDLLRTSASLRFVPSDDQTPVHGTPGVDYGVSEMEYDEE